MVGTGAEGRGKGELSSEFRVSVRQDEKFERFAAVRIQLTLPQCTRKDGQEGKFDVSVVTIILTELKALQRISVCRKGQVPWGQGREENRGVRQAWECVLGSLPRSLWTLAVPPAPCCPWTWQVHFRELGSHREDTGRQEEATRDGWREGARLATGTHARVGERLGTTLDADSQSISRVLGSEHRWGAPAGREEVARGVSRRGEGPGLVSIAVRTENAGCKSSPEASLPKNIVSGFFTGGSVRQELL